MSDEEQLRPVRGCRVSDSASTLRRMWWRWFIPFAESSSSAPKAKSNPVCTPAAARRTLSIGVVGPLSSPRPVKMHAALSTLSTRFCCRPDAQSYTVFKTVSVVTTGVKSCRNIPRDDLAWNGHLARLTVRSSAQVLAESWL
ncbi:hypothetical protein MRX96_052862 [Rhipicephalus microplus]